ncbi:MAG: YraN family protein [Pseudomonadota bacterium]
MEEGSDATAAGFSLPTEGQRLRGYRALLQGHSAEASVERAYRKRGCKLVGKRVRVGPGEIDLIFRHRELIVFVEVKSSRTHERAIHSLTRAQFGRLMGAAECFMASHVELAGLDMRVDLASVDYLGQVRVLPNITL